LDQIVGWIAADKGLVGGTTGAAIEGGVAAANGIIGLIVDAVKATPGLAAKLDAGGNLPRSPPMSATAGVEAETSLVKARLEARWADDQDRVTAGELPTDGWTAIDLRTTWHLMPEVDLIVEGTNLTDEEIRHHASPLKDLAPMAGRGFRVGLRADF
jgi:iron complex outermembrane receptor protein